MDRLLEATYRVEQRHFWWTGPRAFVGPLAAESTRGLTAARILDCGCGSSSMSRRFLSCAAIHSIFGAGFRVMRLTYSNALLFPLRLTVRTGQRIMGLATPEEAGTDVVVPPAAINSLLSGLLLAEARALRLVDMPIGSSLLSVARKIAGA